MSKKNSNVILKNRFKNFEDLSFTYIEFKKKLNKLKANSFVVAISGGPDSLALAALTKAYSFEKKLKFYYVLIDHNIRKNSSTEANQVKKLLAKHNISLSVIFNEEKIKNNIQSTARQIRYKLLSNFCLQKKVKTILTAHNLEDQVETFFIRLSRGSGLSGLSAMKMLNKINSKIQLYRPLLDVKKKILTKISKKVFNKFFLDPSNKDKKYLRTKIRNLQKPLRQSGIDYDQIFKSINNLASSKATLEQYFKNISSKIIKKTRGEIKINLRELNHYNNETKIMIINKSIKTLKKNYYNPRSKKVERLVKNIISKRFKKATLGGCLFSVKKDQLCLKKE